jgi:hypothetical protein
MEPVTQTDFKPSLSLGDGILIGLSGRIIRLGAIVPLDEPPGDVGWRITFVLGLLAALLAMAPLSHAFRGAAAGA